ncbi:MAG TPA: DUF2892 domain-containing protein [Flavobacterium sp.]|uniref:YgaP family membrane protein n=1 Tax=Flavobacterium sp. TaxID=239 RepID=UPI002DB5D547|nr:DUF2892 domain-containing protein [Flavobacterium sp.]HEU4791059.1 DUF2892 domain-containing protein [Flavobacterium sp.]
MKKNIGATDKLIRSAIGIIITILYYSGIINGILAIVLLAFAIILLLTSFINFCPLYALLGINTNKKT